jgi:predicted RNase H-related nuclease YkuK (DUF458 family)
MKKLNVEEVVDFIAEQGPNTKIYLGCDSFRFKARDGKWKISYTTVLVVHMDGRHGCRVFGEIDVEDDYTKHDRKSLSKPRLRLMGEVYRAAEMYTRIGGILDEFEVEIHLDINPDQMHGSSCVINEAIGYIRGVCNVEPLVKPNSWAATHCADHFREYIA